VAAPAAATAARAAGDSPALLTPDAAATAPYCMLLGVWGGCGAGGGLAQANHL
jgi:hypothetical protein